MAFRKQYFMFDNFIDFTNFNFSDNKLRNYIIPLELGYRPDLISFNEYGDTSYQTLLSYINKIDNSPEGFYPGRNIKLLKREYLGEV